MRNDKWWIMAALGIAAGCGGHPKNAPPPQAPPPVRSVESQTKATGVPEAHVVSESPAEADMPAMEPAPPSPMAAPAPEPVEAPSATDPHAQYVRANVQFSEARRQVDIAAGQRDCANACRALDSMERAMTELCELARSSEERRTCKSAEDQVSSARERVQRACGECPKKGR